MIANVRQGPGSYEKDRSILDSNNHQTAYVRKRRAGIRLVVDMGTVAVILGIRSSAIERRVMRP